MQISRTIPVRKEGNSSVTADSESSKHSQNRGKHGEKPSSLTTLRRLFRLAFEYRTACLSVLFLHICLVGLGLSTLGLTGLGIDFLSSVVLQTETIQWPFGFVPPAGWTPFQIVIALSAAILVVALSTAWLKYVAATASAALSQQILIRLRKEIYGRLQHLSFQFYDSGESSSIINRAAGDANSVRNFVDGVVVRLLTVVLTLSIYLVYMFQVHAGLTIACLATTPVLWVGAVVFSRLVQPAYRHASELGDLMIRTLVENLQGIQVVKCFGRESEQAAKFEQANRNIRDQKSSIFFRISTFQPMMGLLTQVNMLILIGYGGQLVIQEKLALGAGLFVFANLLSEFANRVGHITNIVNSIQSSLTSAERVFEVLDEPLRITSLPDAEQISGVHKSIELDRVCFGYQPEKAVLHEISLQISAGECLGITGPTGSGKSTLLYLLKRFYDVDSGVIRFDGTDIRELSLDDVRKHLGIVFQECFLFSNTVAENIAFGDPCASMEQIRAAASVACADQFIRELPDGYESLIGEHGSNLSGGQRQRITLARAILTNPAVLLLDDATASVDPGTEAEISEAVTFAAKGRTTVLVSNRISTLLHADRIVVLSKGSIEDIGTHQELLQRSHYYRQLFELQTPESASSFEPDFFQAASSPN